MNWITDGMSDNTPPPNPFYEKIFICSLEHGHAELRISAPGGIVSPTSGKDIREWLEIILRQVTRWEHSPEHPHQFPGE